MDFQKKILVIEDDERLGLTIQNILMVHKYDVCYTNNGASGIQKAFEYNPDLILCDINMDTIDGYQVYKVLEESSILNRIPFIFLTGSSELEDIRYGMSLGADDYLVKPFVNADLLRSIEKRLDKFRTIREEARHGFNQLFEISPVGIFLFDDSKIFKANKAFINLFKSSEKEIIGKETGKLFESASFKKVLNGLKGNRLNKSDFFDDKVTLTSSEGEELEVHLTISEFEKFSSYRVFIGITNPVNKLNTEVDGKQYASEIYSLLKHENIKISEALGEKITEIFKQKSLNPKNQNNTFFTKRENQILCLSMEGLPIKIIADRLAISDRTVEKHRTKLMEKSGANNMIEVIVFALKNSLVEI
ncbi:MAG: response regulator [Prolixibacteraceae bacterium]|nr:response regulator [Prolixibacteraceae bacterium]